MKIFNAFLILISILILLYVNYTIVEKEKYIDYNSFITIPTTAYDKAFSSAAGGKKYFVEFEDKFFKDALDKNIYNQVFNYDGFVEIKEYNSGDMKGKVSGTIEKILNKALPIEDNSLFNVVDIQFVKVMRQDTKYVVTATTLIHRLNKAYGLSLKTTTYHEPGSSALIEYEILGFVFEDKLNTNVVEPANLNSGDELSYEDLMKTTIIKDKQYEHDTYCKYISDLKKFRNIDYPENTGC